MSDLYDDAVVQAAADAFWDAPDGRPSASIRAMLDAVAPLIAARALRDAADYVQSLFEPASDLYAGDMVSILDRRADEIEAGQ